MAATAELTRGELVATLKRLEPALRAKGIAGLAIYGSRARGDHRPDSNLDVLVDAPDEKGRNAFMVTFDVQDFLRAELGLKIDVLLRDQLSPRAAERAATDMIEVF